MIKVNRYWNSDPDSLVECERPQTYDLCKCCELVNQLVWREKRLKRALYKACANWAKAMDFYEDNPNELWSKMKYKCRAKAEEYK